MGWNVNSLIFLLGLPVVGVCAAALYILYNQDDDELDDTVCGVKTSRSTILEMKIPKASVGVVIGRAGSNVKEIEQRSDTKINFKDELDDDSRTCVIRGSNEGVQLAEAMIHEIIMNQPLIDTFELWVPRRAVGRIIGRCGESIRDISRASNAKISVDRSFTPADGEHRIVIKGTSEQIAVAKSLIEEKVEEDAEARRKLEMSASNRSPRINPNKALDIVAANSKNEQALKRLSFEKLVPVGSDGFLEVYVSAVWNPSKFWVQVISPKTVELDHLVDQMTDYYQIEMNRELHEVKEVGCHELNATLSESSSQAVRVDCNSRRYFHPGHESRWVRTGQIVAAPFDYDEKWYRAEVCEIVTDEYDEEENKLNLYYVDYGDSGYKKLKEVCQLRTDFLKLQFQAIECCLARIKPSDNDWSEEAVDHFEELSHVALWRPLRAHIVNYREHKKEGSPVPCLDLFDTSGPKDIDIGAELVAKGFAVLDEGQEFMSTDGTHFNKNGSEKNLTSNSGSETSNGEEHHSSNFQNTL